MTQNKPDHRRGTSAEVFTPNWLNISFIVPAHLIGFLAWPIYLMNGGTIQWQECFAFFLMYAIGAIGINVGYHRALSHLSFKMSKGLRAFVLFAGSSVVEGSVLTWCSDHRRHHKFQDTDNDPYNIKRGFWWAHMGWIVGNTTTNDFSNCPDLLRDPLIRHQHKYYPLWMVTSCFLFPLILGFLLGRPLEVFLLAGFMRLALINHATYLINSYAHYFGSQKYSREITARDSLVCAILAQGEGWHNFHHRFPWDYRNGHRFYHYDPAKWFIMLGKFFGFAKDLKVTPACEIYRARIQTMRGRVQSDCPQFDRVSKALESALNDWQRLTLEWQKFKDEFEQASSEQMALLKQNMLEARKDFQQKYQQWLIEVRAQPALVRA